MINIGRLIVNGLKGIQLRHAKTKILVIGDSHSKIFRNYRFLLKLPRVHFHVAAKGGATASRLATPNSKTQAYRHFRDALDKINRDLVVVQLGEVDTGYVIWYRAKKYQSPVDDMFQLTIKTYTDFLVEIISTDRLLVISAPLPTISDGNDWGKVADQRKEVVTTQKERTMLTIRFNKEIGEFCKKHNIGHLNLDADCIGDDGIVSKHYLNPNPLDHHYHEPRYISLIAVRMKKWLQDNGFGT